MSSMNYVQCIPYAQISNSCVGCTATTLSYILTYLMDHRTIYTNISNHVSSPT